jgi:peptidylprolyl isomerase
MAQAKNKDKVKVNYKGTLKDGSTFDSSEGREPLEFEIGCGHVIPGFENGVIGLEPGQKKTIQIPFGEAYGAYDEAAVINIPRTELPEGLNPEVGQMLQLSNGSGQVFAAEVKEANADSIKIDANHPLAGKDLTFEIELLEIVQ